MGSRQPIAAFCLMLLLGAGAEAAADVPSRPFLSWRPPPPIIILPPPSTHPAAEETKDRLSTDRMEQLVAPAIALARAGNLSGSVQVFYRLLTAPGAWAPLSQADLLESFGALLVDSGMRAKRPAMIAAGVPYLAQALPLYETVFGAAHPEMALALQTYADGELALNPFNPPQSVITAGERVYDIRVRTLGPSNFETLAARMHLREVQGLPAFTARDPNKVKAAANDLREIITAIGDTNVYQATEVRLMASFDIAIIYLNNGDAPQALAAAKTAWASMAMLPADVCMQYQYVASHWLSAVKVHAEVAAAAAILRESC